MTIEAPIRDLDALALRGRAKSIIRGRSGRLFYEDYEGASLATLTAAEPFPSALEHRWRRTLETRARRLRNRGLSLYVLFGPDAHFVYPDELPQACGCRNTRSRNGSSSGSGILQTARLSTRPGC